jgi:hypothetical protein
MSHTLRSARTTSSLDGPCELRGGCGGACMVNHFLNSRKIGRKFGRTPDPKTDVFEYNFSLYFNEITKLK